jgi:hypothetical protein
MESSEEPGFVPSRGGFLARTKFSSQGLLTAEREPTENMTISLTPVDVAARFDYLEPAQLIGGPR